MEVAQAPRFESGVSVIEKIASLDDERLDVYARLTEVQLRNKLEPEKGIFIAESDKVIDRALTAGYEPLSLLIPEHKLDAMRGLIERAQVARGRFCDQRNWEEGHEAQAAGCKATDVEILRDGRTAERVANGTSASIDDGAVENVTDNTDAPEGLPVFVAPASEIEKLAGYELTRGVLCAMRRKLLPSVCELLETTKARRIAILEDITNHTNVGAAFRSAAALGIDAILVTPTCCDPLYRRAVRVSMGTVFQVPWTRIGMNTGIESANCNEGAIHASADEILQSDAWPVQGLQMLRGLGFKSAALALNDNSISLDDPQLKECEKLAVVLGTEGDGLSDHTIAACDYTVKIPMAHGVDSLNVAAASAVAFWELRVR